MKPDVTDRCRDMCGQSDGPLEQWLIDIANAYAEFAPYFVGFGGKVGLDSDFTVSIQ